MKQVTIDLSGNPRDFPVLSTWPPARLTETLRAMVKADGKEPTRERLLGYAVILESDLESSRALGPAGEAKGTSIEDYMNMDWHELPPDLRDQLLGMEVTTDEERMEDLLRRKRHPGEENPK